MSQRRAIMKGNRQVRKAAPFLPLPVELALAAGHKTDPNPDHAIYRFTLVK